MTPSSELAAALASQLQRAYARLGEKHLLGSADDAVSVLLPGADCMLFRRRSDEASRQLALNTSLAEAALHARTYRLRPDAGALASFSTATSAALAARRVRVPVVFDEQARHIGEAWSAVGAAELPRVLARGANAGLVDGKLLVIGVTPSRMIYNAELFEKSARAYLLARGPGAERKTHVVPWWVRLIAGRRLRRDQREAARHHRAGRAAPELVAY